jgi:cation diffusion facilitator family transporter
MGHDHLIDYSQKVKQVLIITLILNIAVASAKVFYGYFTNSISMTSDGFHSFFDGLSNVIGLIGIWIASHPPDDRHPYGHKKFETLFTIAISFMIFMTCFQILKKVYFSFKGDAEVLVTLSSFIIMVVTLGINIFVAIYETKKGKELKSDFLIADAMHTKSDVLASVAVIVSLVAVKMGYPRADGIVGLIITFFIARMGYEILKKATDTLVDTVIIDTSVIESIVNKVDGILCCTGIRTRGSENSIYLDMTVFVSPDMTIEEAHKRVDSIEALIKKEIPTVVDVVVHIEPQTDQ